MKVRAGFVSNSSSSSFVVDVRDWFLGLPREGEEEDERREKFPRLISEEQEKLLMDYGFQWVPHAHPSVLEATDYLAKLARGEEEPVEQDDDWPLQHLGFSVVCNEDDVIDFLIRYRIPFTGATHYGHTSVFYDGGDELFKVDNLGLFLEMYHGKPHRTDEASPLAAIQRAAGAAMIRGLCSTEYVPRRLAQAARFDKVHGESEPLDRYKLADEEEDEEDA